MPHPDWLVAEDDRFSSLILPNAQLDRLWQAGRWCEGPAYFAAGRYLLWSDIPNDRILRYDENDGHVSVFRQPAAFSNGQTLDREGRLVTCEHGSRSVTRTEHNGRITTLADAFEGLRLNSPNDVAVKSDGSIWFTDPSYGIDSDYEGGKRRSELDCHVYCLPPDGELRRVADDVEKPNGLAFSPDESWLYVSDTGATHRADGPRHIRRFRVGQDHRLSGGDVFATSDCGLFDGFRLDVAGNLWTSAGDGVHCYAPDGTRLGRILIPETVANVCFGGISRNRLYVCATTSLYAVTLNTRGHHVIGEAIAPSDIRAPART
ncbi:MAG: SMP-30/gluconolactonase/LRE family protein [Salinicola sp.]|uniref:SMP-30/gluconolactonase/LRE family protein n=1 Tax=Salinicola sp. TaxID=1978524 RepID=UPI001D6DAC5A|nr:SMP-30/gluconolactonase/LRE family protein [Salinicola sp.]NRB55911.1 SMP-30/gluconolactonase/LRE family protein [Salinicola sp.]